MRPHRVLSRLLATLCLCGIPSAPAQNLRDLNLQFHGYATQSFIFTNQNNWNTTDSTGHGSFAWTEGVANVTANPVSRLRLGAQARVYMLGNFGPALVIDWASAEYKVNERFGIRAGKVKSPSGIFNEIQDIDPAYLWVLLPQSIYPLASRTGNLAVRGGVLFGAIPLGERFGRVEYRAFGGERVLPASDGYFEQLRAIGLTLPHGVRGPSFGETLGWRAPLRGLFVAAASSYEYGSGDINAGPLSGRETANPVRLVFSTHYEHQKLMVAGEYSRFTVYGDINFTGVPKITFTQDERDFYVMTSYKLAPKLTAGAYYSSTFDLQKPLGPLRYQKDWTVSSRYDFNSLLYLKLEQHFLDGTHTGFSLSNNSNGLQETSRLSLAKLGVTF